MRLLLPLLLASTARAAVYQSCMGFETLDSQESNAVREIAIEVGADTSVLVYHIKDISHSNIPLAIDDNVILSEPNGFGICSQRKASQGYCNGDDVGTFTLKTDHPESEIINKFVLSGESVKYSVQEEGIYCVVAVQEGVPQVRGLHVVETHVYGHLPLLFAEAKRIFFLLRIVTFGTIIALLVFFKLKAKVFIGSVFEDIMFLLMQKGTQAMKKNVVLLWMNESSSPGALAKIVHDFNVIDIVNSLVTFTIYYKLSAGVFGFNKESREKFILEPSFKRCLIVMTSSGIFVLFAPYWNKSIVPLLVAMANLILSVIWMPMLYIIYKNSQMTHQNIMDPVFAQKYIRSRRAIIWIPISVSFFSLASIAVILYAVQRADSLTGSMTTMMEYSLNQNFFFVFLKHIPEFSMVFVQWALLFIWNPSEVNPAEFEDINGHELEEGSGNVKL